MDFKNKLKRLRQECGLSQEALAKSIYVSRSAIAKWESGLGVPNDSNLQELCAYFHVEEDWLMDRRDLKELIGMLKRQAPVIVCAVVGMIAPLVFVVLVFQITRYECPIYISYYYPPISMFEVFFQEQYTFAPAYVLWISVAIWAVTVVFSLLSIAVPQLRRSPYVSLCLNVSLILVSTAMFLLLVLFPMPSEYPYYIFYPSS